MLKKLNLNFHCKIAFRLASALLLKSTAHYKNKTTCHGGATKGAFVVGQLVDRFYLGKL